MPMATWNIVGLGSASRVYATRPGLTAPRYHPNIGYILCPSTRIYRFGIGDLTVLEGSIREVRR